jgi:hypothetical protein
MRNRNPNLELLIVFGTFAVLTAVLFGGAAWLNAAKCERQWARSGLKAEWGLAQGCVVQRKDGTWVPASAIRDMGQ